MFSLSFSEIILISLLFIILVKPKDYAQIAKKCGKIVRTINSLWNQLINQIDYYDDEHKKGD